MGLAGRFNPLLTELWCKSVAIIVGVYFGDDRVLASGSAWA
jgi:hypothetical protein